MSSSTYNLNATNTAYRSNRGERLYNFFDVFPPDVGDTVDYVEGIGHNGIQMAQTQAGLNRLL